MARWGVDALGAWVLKCNPRTAEVRRFLVDAREPVTGWCVRDGARAGAMTAGDRAVFWVSGGDRELTSGVWGVGTVLGPATSVAPDDPAGPQDASASLYVPLDIGFDGPLVPRGALRADPVLWGCELLRVPQMSNPVMLTEAEWEALERLLPR